MCLYNSVNVLAPHVFVRPHVGIHGTFSQLWLLSTYAAPDNDTPISMLDRCMCLCAPHLEQCGPCYTATEHAHLPSETGTTLNSNERFHLGCTYFCCYLFRLEWLWLEEFCGDRKFTFYTSCTPTLLYYIKVLIAQYCPMKVLMK